MKICKKCIQPDTRPGIFFTHDGICGACLWEIEKKKVDWKQRKKELSDIAKWAKKTSKSNYDCVIGVSGGKDSTRQVIVAKEKLGLRCLLVNCEPYKITDIGRYNIENLKNQGFDIVTLKPNPKKMKILMKYDFYKNLNPVKITEFALYSSAYIVSEKFEIPLIVQGENPGLTLGTRNTGVGTDNNAFKANELQTLSSGLQEYFHCNGITKEDLFLFKYNRKKLESKKYRAIWLQYYLKDWTPSKNAKFAKKYGFKELPKTTSGFERGTYAKYVGLDADINPVNQMLKYIKFGFGQTTDQVCYDIREGTISRRNGIKMVLKYDGKCSKKFIKEFCDTIEISIEEFWRVTNKFRGNMWEKRNEHWQNSFVDMLKNEITK